MRSLSSGETRATTAPSRSSMAASTRSSRGRSATVTTSSSSPSTRPTSRAIARAVSGWSPVTIATRMPARRHAAIAAAAPGRGGSSSATSPRRVRSRSAVIGRGAAPARPPRSRTATARTRRPRPGEELQGLGGAVGHDAAGEDRVGRPLDDEPIAHDDRHAASTGVEREPRHLRRRPPRLRPRRHRPAGRACRGRPPSGRPWPPTVRRPRRCVPSSTAAPPRASSRSRPATPGSQRTSATGS